ncbi:glycoside hydrolase family 11 protein [Gilvimarinus polysaccharolyticus]|uniref:glycoside hydrolase family 11 protein n=1 Tax=Gilvimarinus polysaccharolyticus TaxID=863921 RepID=UPI0006738DF4|nr:glycoside hydrolase family 11 protein [Gilvimarinus polysaccharolyticus]
MKINNKNNVIAMGLATTLLALSSTANAEFINTKYAGYPSEGGYFVSHYEQYNDQWAWVDTSGYTESHVNFTIAANNVVTGRGWETGQRNRKINFVINDYQPWWNEQKIVFAVYGWTRQDPASYNSTNDPHRNVVEYYVVENNKDWNPSHQGTDGKGAIHLKTATVDGAEYKYYYSLRENQPHYYQNSESDFATFRQYWAIRQNSRNSGEVDMAKHFSNWENPKAAQSANAYPYTNDWGYQIFMVESYQVGGSVRLNAWE